MITIVECSADSDAETEFEWAFDNGDNFFLGLAGLPANNWFSVAPYLAKMYRDTTVLELESSFGLEPAYEYHLSPVVQRSPP